MCDTNKQFVEREWVICAHHSGTKIKKNSQISFFFVGTFNLPPHYNVFKNEMNWMQGWIRLFSIPNESHVHHCWSEDSTVKTLRDLIEPSANRRCCWLTISGWLKNLTRIPDYHQKWFDRSLQRCFYFYCSTWATTYQRTHRHSHQVSQSQFVTHFCAVKLEKLVQLK